MCVSRSYSVTDKGRFRLNKLLAISSLELYIFKIHVSIFIFNYIEIYHVMCINLVTYIMAKFLHPGII